MSSKNEPLRSHPIGDANQHRRERLKGSVRGYMQPFVPIDTDDWEAFFDEANESETRR